MYTLTENEIEINREINGVFSYVTNMENFSNWFPGVIKVKSDNDLNHGTIGKVYIETVKTPLNGTADIPIEVKEVEKNNKLVTEGNVAPLLPKMKMLFSETTKGHTRLTWKMESRNKGVLPRVFLLPLIRKNMKKRSNQGLRKLKQILES